MSPAERDKDWDGPQLAAHLTTRGGVPPEAAEFVICRITTQPDGGVSQIYLVSDEPHPLSPSDLPHWLASHGLTGAEQLTLAMLIIREVVDPAGLIVECTLERRRGAIDGPLADDPARVTFTGPARMVHFFAVSRDGSLVEVAGTTGTVMTHRQPEEQFASEENAVRAHLGSAAQLIDAREPTLLEMMVGFDSVLHVRLADGREIGCGIGWQGPLPFVLPAAFPRRAGPVTLSPENEAAVQSLVAREDLVRHETRLDPSGSAVVARRRGEAQLLLLRANAGAVTIQPYQATTAGVASEDQARWMRYAETYERLAMLDAWRDADSDDLLVITGDANGRIWQHHIDRDGVETWRQPNALAAAGLLYREHLLPGTLAAADAAVSDPAKSDPVASDTVGSDAAAPDPAGRDTHGTNPAQPNPVGSDRVGSGSTTSNGADPDTGPSGTAHPGKEESPPR